MLRLSVKILGLIFMLWSTQSGAGSYTMSISDASHEARVSEDDLAIPQNEDQAFLNGVVQEIFPGGVEGISTEERAIEILKYTSSALELKNNGGSATKILREGYAICGGLSHVFRILCRKVGIPSRYVGAFYLRPLMGSHAISEVFYGGKWHLLDPTFGMFFYSNDEYDRKGVIASFHDLTVDQEIWQAFKVVEKPWLGKYDDLTRSFKVRRAEPEYLSDVYNTSIVDLYRKYTEETFPVAYGSGDRVSFPVDANLRGESEFKVGEVDDGSRDVVMQALNGSSYVGSHYVGGSSPPGFHTWSIKTVAGAKLVLTYEGVGDRSPELMLQPLKGVRLIQSDHTEKGTIFGLLVIDDEAIISVHCADGTFIVDAMKLEMANE
jgi:hypothetical protein